MNNAVDEIKDRLPIEELVSQYVQLKKTGRSLKGLCPFHSEKTPSFVVSPERGIAYCFGCNRGGDVFKFIQEMEGVDFVDALKMLAERTGVNLEQPRGQPNVSFDDKDTLIQLHERAAAFYVEQLWQTDDGSKVLEYLRKRGLADESIKLFKLGFSPDSYDATYNHLLTKDFTKKMLVSAGLALTHETTIEKIYDRFRGRLMFPIMDSFGRIVGFGGRALKNDQEPKYLNSPETVIYRKSSLLYGFHASRQAIKQSGSVVIVEGYMDFIAAFQAGIKHVVASSGTALTARQLRILKPFVSTLFLAFDMDMAGKEAAHRAFELALEFDFIVKMVELPEGKDIAEYAKSHAEVLSKIIGGALPYVDYFYKNLLAVYGKEGLAAKRRILQEFLPFLQQLRSSIEKDAYIRRLASDLDLKEVQVYDELKKIKLPLYHPARKHGALDGGEDGVRRYKRYEVAELLLAFMIEFPRLGRIVLPKLQENLFSARLKPIYKIFADHYNNAGTEEPVKVMALLPDDLREQAGLVSMYIAEHYGEIGEELVEKEMLALINKLKQHFLSARGEELRKKILRAEQDGDRMILQELLGELNALHKGVKG